MDPDVVIGGMGVLQGMKTDPQMLAWAKQRLLEAYNRRQKAIELVTLRESEFVQVQTGQPSQAVDP